jgi:hypothetical protein
MKIRDKRKHPVSFKTFSEYVHILWRLGIMNTVKRDATIIDMVLKEWVK